MLPNSKGNPSAGELNTCGKFVISTVITVYLGNGTRSAIVAMER